MEIADHGEDAHVIEGSPHEQLRQIMARHLCGWISGHGAPIEHFLADADMILGEAHEHGIRHHLVPRVGTVNTADGFIDQRISSR